ncbi:MAG: T9SS type A sorting domain-containing protein, partial [Flavobacteriales bacterium]|nr:T9SS type A sorting domain-containing protein [Flavobacteriales bacterium]
SCSGACNEVFVLQSAGQPWLDSFNETPCANTLAMDDQIGGAWLVTPDSPSAVAGDDLDILLGQFTVCGSLCVELNALVFPEYAGPGSPSVQQVGLSVGSGCSDLCASPGCMDPDAANYDALAECEPIGTCVYCNLELQNVVTNNPTCAYGSNGSIDINVNGGEGFVRYWLDGDDNLTGVFGGLENGTYQIEVVDEYFEPGFPGEGILPDGCTLTVEVEINTPDVVFENASITPVSCFGLSNGCAAVDIAGGTGMLDIELKDCNTGLFIGGGDLNLGTGEYCEFAPGSYYWFVTDASNCTFASNCFNILQPSALQLNTNLVFGVTCAGESTGSATIGWFGGTGDVNFAFSEDGPFDIDSGVFVETFAAGEYTIYGQDENGCVDNVSFEITSPDPIVNLSATSPTTCSYSEDGCVTFEATGGNGPAYVFNFEGAEYPTGTNICGLMQTSYALEITDVAGCTEVFDLEIPGAAVINPNAVIEDVSCNGLEDGSISSVPTGGTGPFDFELNGVEQSFGFYNELAPAGYVMTITDSEGCILEFDFVVVEPAVLEANAATVDVLCAGGASGQIEVFAQGGTGPYDYSINGGPDQEESIFTGLDADTYDVEVVDANGCEAQTTVEVNDALPIVFGDIEISCASSLVNCDGSASVDISGGAGGYTCEWINEDGEKVSTSASPDDLCAGDYTVVATDANECEAQLEDGIEMCVGLYEYEQQWQVELAPNPANHYFNTMVSGWSGEALTLRIMDTSGKCVATYYLGYAHENQLFRLSIDTLAAGMYVVEVADGHHQAHLQLVVE